VINPTDRPDDSPREIDLDRAVRRALEERTDLAQAKQQLTANDATLRYLLDQTRPQVDLVGSYALAGLGGTRIVRSGNDIINSPIVGTIPGAYGTALGSLLGFDYPTWGVALNVTYPIGYSAARAEAARAEIQVSQAGAQARHLEVQVITDITNAAIAVRNAFDEIEPAKQASDLAEQRLDAEQKKFSVGMSTNYLVVQAQKDLADARNALLRAEINYQKSLVDFDRAQQTTLQAAGVTIVSTAGLLPPSVGSGRPVVSAPSGAFIP
jgi:outer membrane protein